MGVDKPAQAFFDKSLLQQIVAGVVTAAIVAVPAFLLGEGKYWWVTLILAALTAAFVFPCMWYASAIKYHDPKLSFAERAPYTRMRTSLAKGGSLARFYDRGVKWLLEKIATIMGDENGPEWRKCWSAKSFDGLLFFGSAYPILMMFVIWVFNGGLIGEAEIALGFARGTPDWRRIVGLISLLPLVYLLIEATKTVRKGDELSGQMYLLFALASVLASIGAFSLIGVFASAFESAMFGMFGPTLSFAIVGAILGVLILSVVHSRYLTGALVLLGFILGLSARTGLTWVFFDYIGAMISAAIVSLFLMYVARSRYFGYFLAGLVTLGFLFLVIVIPSYAPGLPSVALVLALFLPLLTLANVPFDWLSLGVTRRLLHLNLEKRGWIAALISLADLFIAMIVVILLALAMVAVTQAFNASVIANGGRSMVFDPIPLIEGIANPETRWSGEYWWVYATLFSTFVPSLFNLVIGAMSMMRGIEPLRLFLLEKLPEDGVIHEHDQRWLPAVLALQWPIALAFAGGALWVLFQLVLVIPGEYGAGLLQIVDGFARADYAGQLVRWYYAVG